MSIVDVDLIFRIDGALIKIRSFNKSLLPSAVSRIKIISGMNIAERRVLKMVDQNSCAG